MYLKGEKGNLRRFVVFKGEQRRSSEYKSLFFPLSTTQLHKCTPADHRCKGCLLRLNASPFVSSRQNKLEEALLFSGQFTDALQALIDWLYRVEPQLAEDQPVHGDIDLVMNLVDNHKVLLSAQLILPWCLVILRIVKYVYI
jgi:hypothetical protein